MYTIEVFRKYQHTNDCEGKTLERYMADSEEDGLQWLLEYCSSRDACYVIKYDYPVLTFGKYVNEGDLVAVEYEVTVFDEILENYTDTILQPFVEAMYGG